MGISTLGKRYNLNAMYPLQAKGVRLQRQFSYKVPVFIHLCLLSHTISCLTESLLRKDTWVPRYQNQPLILSKRHEARSLDGKLAVKFLMFSNGKSVITPKYIVTRLFNMSLPSWPQLQSVKILKYRLQIIPYNQL